MTDIPPGLEIQVKNWEKFQHYKDRAPPWIKLYNELLDDYRFTCLQDASKLHLVGIWLLASRLDNHVQADPEWIARKIGATERVDLAPLLSSGFVVLYDPLAARLHDASDALALARASEEAEAETETDPPPARAREADDPERPSPQNPTAGLNDLAEASIRGCYGGPDREGTDELVWGSVTDPHVRERILATAVLRWQGEGESRFNGRFFRSILQAVVAEQSAPHSEKREPTGFIAYDSDYEPGGLYYTAPADG